MNELRAALEKKRERPHLRRMLSASADSGEVLQCLRKIGDAVELFLVSHLQFEASTPSLIGYIGTNQCEPGRKTRHSRKLIYLEKPNEF